MLETAEALLGVDPARMAELCEDAQLLAESVGDDYLRALARHRLGDALRAAGRNNDACALFDEARRTFELLGHPLEAARTRVGWVFAAANLGRLSEVLQTARKARVVLSHYHDDRRLANLELNVGNACLEYGHYKTALHHFTQAMRVFGALGPGGQIGWARSKANRGLALTRLGRYQEAVGELEIAREVFRAANENAGYARVARTLGMNYRDRGRYTRALRSFEEARSLFIRLGAGAETVMMVRDTADCYLQLNRPADALAILADIESEPTLSDNVHDLLGVAVRKAAAQWMLGRAEAARTTLENAERDYASAGLEARAWLAVEQAAMLLAQGAAAQALVHARAARAVAKSSGRGLLAANSRLVEAAALVDLNHYGRARTVAADALMACRRLDAASLVAGAEELLGRIAEASKRPTAAKRHYLNAIEQLEREQSNVIFEFRDTFALGRYGPYERLASLEVTQGRSVAALSVAERAKSRALIDAIDGKVELRPRGNGRRLARDLARAREDYAAAKARSARRADSSADGASTDHRTLPVLEARIAALRQQLQLAVAAEDVNDLYGSHDDVELPQVATDHLLVEYFASGNDLIRFEIRERRVDARTLPGAKPHVDRLIHAFRANVSLRASANASAPHLNQQARAILSRLYERLLGDLDLDRIGGLIVVPDGPLHYLPFQALHDGSAYVVERLAVSYAPSLRLLQICRNRSHRRSRGALVFAHSADGLLHHVEKEAEAVARVLSAPTYVDAAATRRQLIESGSSSSIVHLAAHGEFRGDAPLFSHIQLADGPLSVADVFDLRLRANLVTLSACETGRSHLGGGDELVGLVRAFLYAGAARLVVSQWRVNDPATTALMARFYEALGRRETYAQALQTSQRAWLTDHDHESDLSHPFYWAGFQLIGDGAGHLYRSRLRTRAA